MAHNLFYTFTCPTSKNSFNAQAKLGLADTKPDSSKYYRARTKPFLNFARLR
jgi:hypothetical protein